MAFHSRDIHEVTGRHENRLPTFAQVKFTVTHDSVARSRIVHDLHSRFTVNCFDSKNDGQTSELFQIDIIILTIKKKICMIGKHL